MSKRIDASATAVTDPERAPDTPVSQARIPVLDGLRGLAILLVMMVHFEQTALRPTHWINQTLMAIMRTGWSGVDLFFVLSGFLITGVLCAARERPDYFRNFYMRRVLRIFPLYYVSLIVLVFVIPALVEPAPFFHQMQVDSPWYATYLANVKIAFTDWPQRSYIAHFWSLGVEEQFYLVWPILVLVLSPRSMMLCCVGLIVSALGLRIGLYFIDQNLAAYVLMPARVDSLAVGSLLALAARQPGGLVRFRTHFRITGIVAVAVIVSIFVHYRDFVPENPLVVTIGFTALSAMFASVLSLAIISDSSALAPRIWRSRPLTFFGRYSYALYVVHPAVIFFWPLPLSAPALWTFAGSWFGALLLSSAMMLAVCVALAMLSWHLLEKHFLRMRFRFATGEPAQIAAPERAYAGPV